jgi:hypothetical protein
MIANVLKRAVHNSKPGALWESASALGGGKSGSHAANNVPPVGKAGGRVQRA